jgi:glycosyltransferase involved in cell wall biosynthesis
MKKVLFITYFWPPSGKATVHWPLRIIKHLPEFGWQPVVLTADEDTFSSKDESLLEELDPGPTVFKAKAREPFGLYRRLMGKEKDAPLTASETISRTNRGLRHRLAIWIRMNLFVPDARIGWYGNAVREGKKVLGSENVQAVVSIGPPHTTLLVGKKLSGLSGLPHVPVFIDPWVDISYYRGFKRSRPTFALDRRFERSVLESAACPIFVTESMKTDYEKRYRQIEGKSEVLYWGYDEEAFGGYSPQKPIGPEILLHAGNIYDHQNPINLWGMLAKEIAHGRDLRIIFIGTVGPGIRQSIEEAGLSGRVEFRGFLPYKKMIEELSKATYLLVCASEKRHVPGKLFEYLRSEKPVIAFGDDNEEVKNILACTNSGMIFPMAADGKEFFEQAESFRADLGAVRSYDRRQIAFGMARILDSLL